ncbi:TIGR03364 family FAD-dependent oxidoreductase [Amnibacterium setariae]|uniref:TIGR03364 family FAD-dependent oxidoreductase n=1 Tax=Amnibacterium setariae TaxID=2306585 RepID=A0A3A1TUY2_9MICO|nr:TIGR03364 family FAD-dependent oxidoreductase [Amnibacterium setariae]RIX28032.1 TIGR03364 family FAD-dependent oxidoreductase [Amnibacterium setariae]
MERSADLVVVGAGVVGLAHAWHAVRAGLRVVVVERDERAVGASVRNFGHVCTTAQAGEVLELALVAREEWLRLASDAELRVQRTGTAVVARTDAQARVLEEFAAERGDAVRPLTAGRAEDLLGFAVPGLVAAAHLPADLRVDPTTAVAVVAAHLERLGVEFLWRTNVLALDPGVVRTTRGVLRAAKTVLAVGHDVDRFLPDVADVHGLVRCRLRMMEVDSPVGVVPPAVLTGSSMLRYDGLAQQPSAAAVRAELAEASPALLEQGVNLMLTQRPDGRLVIGDTHHSGITEDPFEDERSDALILDEVSRLIGAPLTVRRRWRGVYASSPKAPFLVAEPMTDLLVVSVTTGIGMTTALGLARRTVADHVLSAAAPALVTT